MKRLLTSFTVLLFVIFFAAITYATDDHWETATIYDFSVLESVHYPSPPNEGWYYFTLTNQTDSPWVGYQFDIVDTGTYTATALITDSPLPQSSQTGSWVIGTGSTTINYYFSGDPVAIGNTATFDFYVDNTIDSSPFAVQYSPTAAAAPEPLSMLLFITGGVPFAVRRFWKRSR